MKKIRNILLIISICTLTLFIYNVTLAYLMTETSPLISTFIPFSQSSNLSITSSVTHNLGKDYIIPDNIKLSYEVDLGLNYANKEINTSEETYTTDENGIFNILIKPNNNIIIYDIMAGTEVKVMQQSTNLGFVVTTSTITTVIDEQEVNDVLFEYTYQPAPVIVDNFIISGKKVLEGRNWNETDSFTFKLEVKIVGEWIEIGKETITYDSSNPDFAKFDLSKYINGKEIPIVGKIEFRIIEEIGDNSITDCDGTINYFYITVGDETMDGYLEVQNVEVSGNIAINVEDNKYSLIVIFNNSNTNELIYADETKDSFLIEDMIVVKNDTYDIETIIENFENLSENYTYKLYDKNNNEISSTLVRTGDYVLINSNNQDYKFYLVLKGDVNGDGKITPIDYVKIKNHIMEEKIIEEGLYKLAADYNNDEGITPLDYVKVKNYIMNGGN